MTSANFLFNFNSLEPAISFLLNPQNAALFDNKNLLVIKLSADLLNSTISTLSKFFNFETAQPSISDVKERIALCGESCFSHYPHPEQEWLMHRVSAFEAAKAVYCSRKTKTNCSLLVLVLNKSELAIPNMVVDVPTLNSLYLHCLMHTIQ